MARLADQLRNHAVHEHLASLRSRVDELNDDTVEAVNDSSEGTLERVPVLVTYVQGVLTIADPNLTTANMLSRLETALQNALAILAQLDAQPQIASTLDQHLEEALEAVLPIAVATPLVLERAGAATEVFDNALRATVNDVKQRADSLAELLDSTRERGQEIAVEAERANENREQSANAAILEVTERIDAEKQRLDQLVTTQESAFSEAQEARDRAFEQLRTELSSAASKTEETIELTSKKVIERLETDSDATLEQVRDRKAEVDKLFGVITDTSTSGAFHNEAKAQKESADQWRAWTIGFGSVAAILALAGVVAAMIEPDSGTSTSAIVAKATATIAAAGLAAYAGRQSGRHRHREEEAKRLELELAAFSPFIESLEESQKQMLRETFANRMFRGRPDAPAGAAASKSDAVGLPALVASARDLVAREDQGTRQLSQ